MKKLNNIMLIALTIITFSFLLAPISAKAAYTQLYVDSWLLSTVDYVFPAGASQDSALAGEIYVRLIDPTGELPTLSTIAYCVELDVSITGGGPYETSLGQVGSQIAWLMENYSGGSRDEVAALQVSIWETLYGNDFTLTSGGNIGQLSEQYLDALSQAMPFSSALADYLVFNYKLADNGDFQNLIVRAPGNPAVPEPSIIILLGAGLLGLAGVSTRKKLQKSS